MAFPLQPDPEAVKLEQRTDVSDSLQEIADSELEEKPVVTVTTWKIRGLRAFLILAIHLITS